MTGNYRWAIVGLRYFSVIAVCPLVVNWLFTSWRWQTTFTFKEIE